MSYGPTCLLFISKQSNGSIQCVVRLFEIETEVQVNKLASNPIANLSGLFEDL